MAHEIHAAIIFLCWALALYLALVLYDSLYDSTRTKTYYVTFDGNPTEKEQNLTLTVDNNANNSQFVYIYGLPSILEPIITLTDFADKMGNIVSKNDVGHDIIRNGEIFLVEISAASHESGLFHGSLARN